MVEDDGVDSLDDEEQQNENDTKQENIGDEECTFSNLATLSFKKSQQSQLDKSKNEIIPIVKSRYQNRLEGLKVVYQKLESRILVSQGADQFQIPICNDDSVGGKYDWKINDVMLGVGSQGRVYKSFCSKQMKNFALKMIEISDFESDEALNVIYEALILKKLNGENSTIQLFDIFGLFKQTCTLVLVMEYCQCNLLEICNIREQLNKQWDEVELVSVFSQLLKGNEAIQKQDICHRDIKLQNILFSVKQKSYKIGDFSESKIVPYQKISLGDPTDIEEQHSFRGTWKYLSPEISVAFQKNQDVISYTPFQSDLFSFGIMFGDLMFFKQIPFQSRLLRDQERSLSNRKYLASLIQLLNNSIQNNERVFACQIVLTLLNEVPQKREEYKNILKTYYSKNIEDQKNQFKQDESFASTIEMEREMKTNIPRFQKAKHSYLIAQGYEKILRFEQAIETYLTVIELAKHLSTKRIKSRTLYNIGHCYEKLGKFKESLSFYEQCYTFRKLIFKPSSSRMGEILNGLGIAHRKLGNYQQSKKYYEESLSIALNRYGNNHLTIANMHNNIGSVYFNLKQLDNAIVHFEKALKIMKMIGQEREEHDVLNNLSMVYLEQKEYQKSEEYMTLAYKSVKQFFGEKSIHLINILINIGSLEIELSRINQDDSKMRLQKSMEYFQNASQLVEGFYGSDYYQLGQIYNSIGTAYQAQQEYPLALQYYEKSITLLKKYNSQHTLWQIYSSMAAIYVIIKNYDQGIINFKKCLEIQELVDTNVIKKADINYNIGYAYLYKKDYPQAQQWLSNSLECYKQGNNDHPNIKLISAALEKIKKKAATK